jgi:carbon-monoxide dehydrogenase medium subunit
MWQNYYIPSTLDDALRALAGNTGQTRVISGGTDLLLEMERGQRKDIDTLVDISRLTDIQQIRLEGDVVVIGGGVTHNQLAASQLIQKSALPLALAAWNVGSPQIRNRGTVGGNLLTGSPANDTITPLFALEATLECRSTRGTRQIPIKEFYTGVRKTVLAADEMLTAIRFKALGAGQKGTFIKFALRRAQAISVLNTAVILTLDGEKIQNAVVTLGAVAPTIIHAVEAEEWLKGKKLTDDLTQFAELVSKSTRPIGDIRGSAAYRAKVTGVIARRAVEAIRDGEERMQLPESPVTLTGKPDAHQAGKPAMGSIGKAITATVNGKQITLQKGEHHSLHNLLRENALLTGIKEGCGEGECGACTIHLDGAAVMSCLVPAERAAGAEIVTIEGIAQGEQLHPLQQAFIDEGAVQCGYCTPGFIMSAVKLLEEKEHPDRETIRQAITGNLCRCTGYYKIITAIEKAGEAVIA